MFYRSAQLPAHPVVEPLTLGVAGSTSLSLRMVKPTGTMDGLLSKNRFAALSSNGASGKRNPPTLTVSSSAVGGATSLPSGKSRWFEDIENSPGFGDNTGEKGDDCSSIYTEPLGKNIRNRSNSTKRKNSAEDSSNAKSARIEVSDCPHLKALNENSKIITKVLESLADHTGNDPIVSGCVKSLAITMNSMNDILGVVMAERLIPGSSPEVTVIEPVTGGNNQSNFPFPPVNNSRKPLNQQPIGNTESWSTAVSRQTKKAQQVKKITTNSGTQQTGTQGQTNNQAGVKTGELPFVKAVKEAERSLLIFNLDMGQSTIMNPGTISAKVMVGLLYSLESREGGQKGNYSQDDRDMVDDIISQVVRMEFFGSKTAPCKFPNNQARNGEFYTVPVKMVFKDRKIAQTAADLLRTYFKIYPTTPYHKSLRAAITQAINKAKEANPGNHAKVNVYLNGKTLKCFIREDTNPPGKWNALDIRVPIPLPALDPGLRDISKVILPTSPNDPSLISNGLSKTRATDNRAKPTFENNQESMDTGDTCSGTDANGATMVSFGNLQKNLEKVNAELSPLPAFMNTPKAKNKGNLPPVRSSLTLRSPPPGHS